MHKALLQLERGIEVLAMSRCLISVMNTFSLLPLDPGVWDRPLPADLREPAGGGRNRPAAVDRPGIVGAVVPGVEPRSEPNRWRPDIEVCTSHPSLSPSGSSSVCVCVCVCVCVTVCVCNRVIVCARLGLGLREG